MPEEEKRDCLPFELSETSCWLMSGWHLCQELVFLSKYDGRLSWILSTDMILGRFFCFFGRYLF